jgi:hypothetical protein
MTTTLAILLTAATLIGGAASSPRKRPQPRPRAIVVQLTRPGLQWSDVGIGAAAGAGLVLLLVGATLVRTRATTQSAREPIERRWQ